MTKLFKNATMSLAAAGMLTSAFAGVATLTVAGGTGTGGAYTAASEIIGTTAAEDLATGDINLTVVPTFTGSLSQGSILFTFSSDINDTTGDPSTYFMCANTVNTGGVADAISGAGQVANGNQIIFDLNGTAIVTGDTLYVADDVACGVADQVPALGFDVATGTTGITAQVDVTNSATTVVSTSAATNVITFANQLNTTLTLLDSAIDASTGFTTFRTGDDDFEIAFTSDVLDINSTFTTSTALLPDQNVSLFTAVTTTGAAAALAQGADNNYTFTTGAAATESTGGLNFDDSTGEAIVKTNFTVASNVTFTTGGHVATAYATGTNAGAWTIFGYSGQIPNVSTSPSVETTLIFTNRSSINSDVYFTIIDAAGNTDVVDSVNDGIASIATNETKKYKMGDLLALTTGLTGNAFAVEVTIPTTPTSVYGYASFKNLDLGQFKDLPIYNNGNSY